MPIQKPSLISIVDDKGNPLFKQNSANVTNDSALQKGKPDLGFTPPESFLISSDPRELGNSLKVSSRVARTTNAKLADDKKYQENFPQANGVTQFKYDLNKTNSIPENSVDTRTIYLGSFLKTREDNEDPTMLGYDLMIDLPTSPLFNGAVENFIQQFQNTREISSRLQTIQEFKTQFYKFFKTNSPVSARTGTNADANAATQAKVHYLKKITGLDKLVEANLSNDAKKSFVDYGTDFITLSLNEDVNQNMGYLSSLYKNLSWSRINGKQVIPENLLRFNLILSITEIRNYNRVRKVQNDYHVLADLISKYEYNLYECQMFFPKMPHGDAIDVSAPVTIDSYDLQFNYKFSTMKFIRFEYQNTDTARTKVMDNQYVDIYQNTPRNAQLVRIGSSIELSKVNSKYTKLGEIQQSGTVLDDSVTVSNSLTQPEEQKSQFRQNLERLGGDLRRAAVNEVNRRVVTQFRLLNRTLDNIRNSIPFAGRMSAPTNVYTQDQLSLATDVQNAIRNFGGRSIRSLFGGSR